jgi:hypothetical protein
MVSSDARHHASRMLEEHIKCDRRTDDGADVGE